MSVTASLSDLGSVTAARPVPPSKDALARSGADSDDAFGQLVREAAQQRSDAVGRGEGRRDNRGRADVTPPDDRQRPDRPELPTAALDNRSANARRGDRADEAPRTPADREAPPSEQPVAGRSETEADQPADQGAADRCGHDGAQAKSRDASSGTDEAVQQPDAGVAVAAALNEVTLAQVAPQAAPAVATVVADTDGQGPAAASPAGAAAPATPAPATAADQAAIAAATESLTEAAPALVVAAEQEPAAVDPSAGPGRATTAGANAGAQPLVEAGHGKTPPESVASPAPTAGEPKKRPQPHVGEAAKTHHVAGKESTPVTAPRADADATQAAPAGQPTIQPQGADALRTAVADAQPPTNAPAATGLVQAAGPAATTDLKAAGPLPTQPRHEIPVPLQAVAIEIGMRAMRGAKEFAIRLDPEDLGRIDVKLEISDAGQVQAKVVVDKVETLQLLQRDARTLERAFDQAGLKTTPDGPQFTLRDPGGQGRHNDDQPSHRNRGGDVFDEPVIDEIRLQPAQYRLAASGGLDIRI